MSGSPCARCSEVYEVEWPAALAFYCGGDIPAGERVLIETQRLRHPRGCQSMITEGPLPGCPKGYADERREEVSPSGTDSTSSVGCAATFPSRGRLQEASPAATGYEMAREMLERSLHAAEDRG